MSGDQAKREAKHSSKSSNNQLSKNKTNFGETYRLEDLIGKGSFGFVYKGRNRESGEYFACKAEKKSSTNKERLRAEYNFYKAFRAKKIRCVPKVDQYLTTKEWNLMFMQLLGYSLDKLFTGGGSQLDLGSVMKIGLMMINGLEEIHNMGVIHRDIKPNNFMFGRREMNDDGNLYIVDFGLSKYWKDQKTGEHIPHKSDRSMIGTARYASINIHLGIEPSRRDDIESMGYVLVYLAKGRLPWQGLAKKKKGSNIDEIKDKKMSTSTKDLCSGLPPCFQEMIDYAKNLNFHEKPDYDAIRKMIHTSAKKNEIDLVLAWVDDPNFYDQMKETEEE